MPLIQEEGEGDRLNNHDRRLSVDDDFDAAASAFQPGAPQHPMQPEVAFSLVARLPLTSMSGKLYGKPGATQEHQEAQLGREDAWLLLLLNSRGRVGIKLVAIVEKLLYDLGAFFYGSRPRNVSSSSAMSVRNRAMIAEAAAMKLSHQARLQHIVELANIIELWRRRDLGR